MNLKNETGLSTYTIAAIVISCAAPAGVLNVWPRIEQMMHEGITGHQLGTVLLVSMSAIGMTSIPFAMKKAENFGFWTTCLLLGIFLGGLNYALAVGAIGKGRDNESNSAEALILKGKQLKERISELKALQPAANSFKFTTEEMLETAKQAVELAKQARDQECGKVGDVCRARVAQLASRQAELGDVSAARALSRRAEEGELSIIRLQGELLTLGALPRAVDPQAERIGALLQVVGITARTEAVATGLIHILAIAAELFGLLMPRVLVTALAPVKPLVALAGNSQGTTTPPALPAPKATSKTPRRSVPGPVTPWLAQMARRAKVEAWTTYQQYKKWCEVQNETPASYTAFRFELKGKGIKESEEGGKTYFTF